MTPAMRTEAHPEAGVMAHPAVLDIGGNTGAAVVYTTAALDGMEIEIKPHRGDWNGAHTAVRRRPGGQGSEPRFAALFYGLAEGTYNLRLRHDSRSTDSRSIEVFGGCVVEETWQSALQVDEA